MSKMPAIRKREAVRHSQSSLSYRHTAFHFCEWALGQKKLTIKKIVAYMKANGLTATEWRARALKIDWLEYKAITKPVATAPLQSAGRHRQHSNIDLSPLRPRCNSQRRV